MLERTLTGTACIYVPGPPDDEENAVMGNHAVQLVGWGQERSVPYWIIANSWGASNTATDESGSQDYGNNGYFMIVFVRRLPLEHVRLRAGAQRAELVHENKAVARHARATVGPRSRSQLAVDLERRTAPPWREKL